MNRTGRIWAGVVGGVVFVSAAGGTFWWLQSRSVEKGAPLEVPLTQSPSPTTPAPAGPVTTPAPATPAPAESSGWALTPLPAGSVKIERGGAAVLMTEPGLVRFDVQTGESIVWHWSREVQKDGAVPAGDWAVVQGPTNLLIHLPTGDAFRFTGRLLWHGKAGALIQVAEGSRKRLILTDASFKVQSERWLPDGLDATYNWQRAESGWFHFQTNGQTAGSRQEYRFSTVTGGVELAGPYVPSGLWLEQLPITPAGCGGDGGGNLVKVRQGNQVLWTVLDSIAPQGYLFGGSRILADQQGALIGTFEGPTLLQFAEGRLQAAPELKGLGTPVIFTSPTDPKTVAAVPKYLERGSYLLLVQQLGQASPSHRFTLRATTTEQNVGVTVESPTYWSEDGRYIQMTVNYPDGGGKCGSGDDWSTFLAPVVVKGDWKGPYQVETKVAQSLYAAQRSGESWSMGSVRRTAVAGERFTLKAIINAKQPIFVVALPEGEGILLPDPAQLQWVR